MIKQIDLKMKDWADFDLKSISIVPA